MDVTIHEPHESAARFVSRRTHERSIIAAPGADCSSPFGPFNASGCLDFVSASVLISSSDVAAGNTADFSLSQGIEWRTEPDCEYAEDDFNSGTLTITNADPRAMQIQVSGLKDYSSTDLSSPDGTFDVTVCGSL